MAQNPVLAQADVILAIDSDVPWITAVNRPSAGAAIYCVDVDPLKAQMSMWHVPARRFAAASARVAVEQIARFVRDNNPRRPERGRGPAGGGGPRPRSGMGRTDWALSSPVTTAPLPPNTSPRASGACWKVRTPWS